jgi:hypothetical protein
VSRPAGWRQRLRYAGTEQGAEVKKRFWILVSIYLVLALLDGLLTYIYTPDLSLEGNPLVSVFDFGWGALFIANGLGFALVFLTAYYSHLKYKTIVVSVKNRREYISQILYNRPDKFIWSFYKLPRNWAPVGAILGYALIYSIIMDRIIVVTDWLVHDIWVPIYTPLRHMIPYGRLDIAVALVAAVFLMVQWISCEYKKSIMLLAVSDKALR